MTKIAKNEYPLEELVNSLIEKRSKLRSKRSKIGCKISKINKKIAAFEHSNNFKK